MQRKNNAITKTHSEAKSHADNCDYKIDNYKEKNAVLRIDGIFTEKQEFLPQ